MKRVFLPLILAHPHGGWLRALRHQRGWSLQAVADRLGVTPQAVHQFEKSEVAGTISLRQLALVAAAMGGSVAYSVSALSLGGMVEAPDLAAQPKPRQKRRRSSAAAVPVDLPSPARAAGPLDSPVASTLTPAHGAPVDSQIEHAMFLSNRDEGRYD